MLENNLFTVTLFFWIPMWSYVKGPIFSDILVYLYAHTLVRGMGGGGGGGNFLYMV